MCMSAAVYRIQVTHQLVLAKENLLFKILNYNFTVLPNKQLKHSFTEAVLHLDSTLSLPMAVHATLHLSSSPLSIPTLCPISYYHPSIQHVPSPLLFLLFTFFLPCSLPSQNLTAALRKKKSFPCLPSAFPLGQG